MTTSHPSDQLDAEVDAFVRRISDQTVGNFRAPDDVPPFLRVGEPNDLGDVRWAIRPISSALWLTKLQSSLPMQLPPALRSLLGRYAFPALELNSVRLYANTGEDFHDEMGHTLATDPLLTRVAREAGFIRFAKAPDVNYDPVCFDVRERGHAGDFPVVQLDHEEALIRQRVKVVSVIAPSFRELLSVATVR